MAKSAFAGKLRTRCDLCGHGVWYVSRLTCALVAKQRLDGDTLVSLVAGALLCDACQLHNRCERLCNPQPVASVWAKCNRCGGAGRVPDPTAAGRWEARRRQDPGPGPIAHSLRRQKRCPRCEGKGRVPSPPEAAAS